MNGAGKQPNHVCVLADESVRSGRRHRDRLQVAYTTLAIVVVLIATIGYIDQRHAQNALLHRLESNQKTLLREQKARSAENYRADQLVENNRDLILENRRVTVRCQRATIDGVKC